MAGLPCIYDSEDAALYLGDCLTQLRSMPDKCVDLAIWSPPYEDARLYDMGFKLVGQHWVDWVAERFMECHRVTRGLVACVVEGRTKDFHYTATPMLLAADLHRRGVNLRKPSIYRRVGIPGSGGPDWVRNDYEFIICATHGKLPWSDNTAMGHDPLYRGGGACTNRRPVWVDKSRKTDGRRRSKVYAHPEVANPGNVINEKYTAEDVAKILVQYQQQSGDVVDCKVGGGLMGSDLAHENEAPYPESLVEFFVRSFCPPGGIVLDCFCGSGTSLAVALKHGRMAMGIDCRDDQIVLSMKRIEEARAACRRAVAS